MYKQFRAKFSIWLPNLHTLDGTDFSDDQAMIKQLRAAEQGKKNKAMGGSDLPAIPEENSSSQAADKNLKAQSGTTAFAFNQKAHRKYNSSKSLFERILKSHSEGNRFIRNEDLW